MSCPILPLAQDRAWRLVVWAGRLLLLGAVAFWWGGVVVPHLASLALPERLHPTAIPWHLNPDLEGSAANAVSAAALSTVACLAFVAAAISARRAAGWINVIGWAALAATAAYLAWEEVSDFHVEATLALGSQVLGMTYNPFLWPVLLTPLIMAFVVAMWFFIHKGMRSRAVRVPLILGFLAWLLSLVHEVSYPFVFTGRAEVLEVVLEETLEFSGALLIAYAATTALSRGVVAHTRPHLFRGIRPSLPVVGSIIAVAVFGGLTIAFIFRVPLADARPSSHIGRFHVGLNDAGTVRQELGVLAAPLARLDLLISNRDPYGRAGYVIWRVVEAEVGGSGLILREGRLRIPAGENTRRESIDFPPLAEVEVRPVAVQLVADVEREAHLLLGATNTNQYESGRLWINEELAWTGQNLEFVAYSAPEPTRSKLRAIWRTVTSDWRWSVLAVGLPMALTLITLIPALLVASACPQTRNTGNPPRTG